MGRTSVSEASEIISHISKKYCNQKLLGSCWMKLCVREEAKQCKAHILSGFGNDFILNNLSLSIWQLTFYTGSKEKHPKDLL